MANGEHFQSQRMIRFTLHRLLSIKHCALCGCLSFRMRLKLAVFVLRLHLCEILAASLGNLLWTAEQAQSLNRRFHHVVRIV